MSYDQERAAIEAYFNSNWSATPVGFDDHLFTPVADSVRLKIQDGVVLQGTIGGAQNRIDHVGVLQIQIFVAGGKGSVSWRGYVETITQLFHGVIIDTSGVLITDPANAFIKFAPEGQYPYIGGNQMEPPFEIITVNAPFVRYEMM